MIRMRWTYQELLEQPDDIVDLIIEQFSKENKRSDVIEVME